MSADAVNDLATRPFEAGVSHFARRRHKKRVAHAHPQNQKRVFYLILRVGVETHRE